MKNNEIPFNKDGWNSDEVVLGDLSCKQIAKFLSAYSSAVRAFANEDNRGGALACMKLAQRMIEAQIKLMESDTLVGEERKHAEENLFIGLMTVGQAMVTASSNTDPRTVADLANQSMECFLGILEKHGTNALDSAVLHYHVKAKDEEVAGSESEKRFTVGVQIVPISDVIKKLKSSGGVISLEALTSTQKKSDN